MKLNLIFPFVFFACINSYGQQSPCGFDETRQSLLNTDPSYKEQEKIIDHLLYTQAVNSSSNNRNTQSTLTIPVVVHIIHQNGPENITDSLVIAGIDQLNLRFQNTAPYYDVTGNNTGIQFCLASVDPFGNPTTGITRDLSSFTDLTSPGATDLGLKNINRWDPHLYLNIWVVKNAGGPGGYATYPSAMGSGTDGIVVLYNTYNTSALAHEAGHYLGLLHTFQITNYNSTCQNDNCLLDGDQVCDTPPDNTFDPNYCSGNSCSTEMNDTSGVNPFSSDVNDLPNYMDYTLCPLSFSAGQSNRMNAALTAIRTTLLQSNGCGQHPGGPVPTASFTVNPGCGGAVFTNTSINSVGAQWDFNSDGQIDDAGNSFTYNAPVTGYYNVTMYAQGYGGVDTITQIIFAQHYPYQNYPLMNGYTGLSISAGGLLTGCAGSTIIFQGEPGMDHYYWSNGDTTQNTTFIADTSSFTISLTTIDSAGLTWSTCYPVHVHGVPEPIAPTITIDPNDTSFCIGSPLNLHFTYSPIWHSGSLFIASQGTIPGFHNSTYTTTMVSSNSFVINQTDTNGCSSSAAIYNITGVYPTYPQNIIQVGNNTLYYPPGLHHQWYFNGNPIANSDTNFYQMTQVGCYKVFSWWYNSYECGTFSLDSVCILTVETPENFATGSIISISPNPFTTETTLSFSEVQENTTIKIMDIMGKEIRTFIFTGKQLTIEKGEMSRGIYFVQITDKHKRVTNKKIIIE